MKVKAPYQIQIRRTMFGRRMHIAWLFRSLTLNWYSITQVVRKEVR